FRESDNNKEWLFFMLVFCTFMYTVVKFAFTKEFDSTIKAFTNFKLAQQLYRDREIIQNIPAILMNMGFVLTLAVLVYQLTAFTGIELTQRPLGFVLIIGGFISLILIVRIFIIKFLGWLFPLKSTTDYYAFNLMLANRINGLVLLPLMFVVSFASTSISKPFLMISSTVVVLFYVYKLARGYILAKDFFRHHKFHIILYICTFEISPVLLFAKVFTDNWHKFIT
ncbi:MAG: DUF4271 domain-containing protein, partial [Chitinophagales bacterium]|nr:DUF4271 domain-containing protein [Chitinophagales bacterium]